MNIIVYKTDNKKGKQKFSSASVERKLMIIQILERKRSFGSEISGQEQKLHCQSFNSDKN